MGRPVGAGQGPTALSGRKVRATGSPDQLVFLGRLSGLSPRRRPERPVSSWKHSASRTGRSPVPTICRTATSSGYDSPPPWSTLQTCWCWTNRSPGSTRSRWTRCPRCWPGSLGMARQCCSPATSSTSSSTSARGRRHRLRACRSRRPTGDDPRRRARPLCRGHRRAGPGAAAARPVGRRPQVAGERAVTVPEVRAGTVAEAEHAVGGPVGITPDPAQRGSQAVCP